MTELRFASGDMDRRRRMLAVDQLAAEETALDLPVGIGNGASSGGAFERLTRDQMIRRLISPRLWKHVLIVAGLTLLPLGLLITTLLRAAGRDENVIANGSTNVQNTSSWDAVTAARVFESAAGMELLIAGQLCLLICWVRSGSPVDYRGHYRAWRWLAGFLFVAAFLVLADGVELLSSLLAQLLGPVLGTIESARPALFFVPACAFLAISLRYVILDMGRCRPAQACGIAALGFTILRMFLGLRRPLLGPSEALAALDLLICGLTLSAAQLHCRYVIHVNPHPPVRLSRATSKLENQEVSRELTSTVSPVCAVESPIAEDQISDLAVISRKKSSRRSEEQVDASESKKPKAPRKPSRKAG